MKLRTEREKYLYKRKRYKILIIVTQILLLVAFLGLWEGAAFLSLARQRLEERVSD